MLHLLLCEEEQISVCQKVMNATRLYGLLDLELHDQEPKCFKSFAAEGRT